MRSAMTIEQDEAPNGVCRYHKAALVLWSGVPVCRACLTKYYGIRKLF